MSLNNPIQPVFIDGMGISRFKENSVVKYLFKSSGLDISKLSEMDFNSEDLEQFAQLIGYSINGFKSLKFATENVVTIALKQAYHKFINKVK